VGFGRPNPYRLRAWATQTAQIGRGASYGACPVAFFARPRGRPLTRSNADRCALPGGDSPVGGN
jgi:hypothetical protein